jgi:hypothetical protein
MGGSIPSRPTWNREVTLARKPHKEMRKSTFVCNCGGVCGVNQTHDQMTKAYLAKYGDDPHNRSVDAKWRMFGKLAKAGRL